MKKGFFSTNDISTSKSMSTTPRCGLCKLHRTCIHPKMPPTGKGRKRLLFVAEAPGRLEDEKNTQLIGKSGQYLRSRLKRYGINLDVDAQKTNAVICRPPKNETPTSAQIAACRPNVLREIESFQPTCIILLGATAVESVIPIFWKDKIDAFSRWTGWHIPIQNKNVWICPTYHPSYILRKPGKQYTMLFNRHIKAAIKLQKLPWVKVPDYSSGIEIITSPSQAGRYLYQLYRSKPAHATWDLEASSLKPDTPGAEIVCCSVCTGPQTVVFPWAGDAVDEMLAILRNPHIRKIAANNKFEHRWILHKHKMHVRGWYYDVVLGAHILDNRPKVTGVKFQSFARLGLPSYNDNIEPYIRAPAYKLNKILELPITDVMLYCGMDAKVEDELAIIQIPELIKQGKIHQHAMHTHNT